MTPEKIRNLSQLFLWFTFIHALPKLYQSMIVQKCNMWSAPTVIDSFDILKIQHVNRQNSLTSSYLIHRAVSSQTPSTFSSLFNFKSYSSTSTSGGGPKFFSPCALLVGSDD